MTEFHQPTGYLHFREKKLPIFKETNVTMECRGPKLPSCLPSRPTECQYPHSSCTPESSKPDFNEVQRAQRMTRKAPGFRPPETAAMQLHC